MEGKLYNIQKVQGLSPGRTLHQYQMHIVAHTALPTSRCCPAGTGRRGVPSMPTPIRREVIVLTTDERADPSLREVVRRRSIGVVAGEESEGKQREQQDDGDDQQQRRRRRQGRKHQRKKQKHHGRCRDEKRHHASFHGWMARS